MEAVRPYTTQVMPSLKPEKLQLLPFKMRVKNDHRSEFSNLSNWKEEA